MGGAAIVALAGFAGTGTRMFQPVLVGSPPPYMGYVTNSGSNTVTPFNAATRATGTPIAVGTNPVAVAITPDASTAYVVNKGSGTVTPIDTVTNTPGTPITVGSAPTAIAITPDGTTAYVANSGSNSVTPITLATDTPGTPIPVGSAPSAIAITPDGTTAYVADRNDNGYRIIDLTTNSAGTTNFSAGWDPAAVAITPDGDTLYFANDNDHTVTAVDTATRTTTTIDVVSYQIKGVAVTPSGQTAYATSYSGATVIPINTSTQAVGTAINVLGDPWGIAITPDGSTGYTTHAFLPPSNGWINPFDVATNWSSNVQSFGSGGVQPTGIAITPDQAPVAQLSVTPWPAGAATHFDASASTVRFTSIASYTWDFGDGSAPVTTSAPTTNHVYATAGTYTASVTETSSTGTTTTTADVFTGQTLSRNGGPQARTQSTFTVTTPPVPTVSGVSPAAGPAIGGTTVAVSGSGFYSAVGVSFGAGPAPSFTITDDTHLSAVSPAGSGTVDVTVASVSGTSATSAADHFTYAAPTSHHLAYVTNNGSNTVTPVDTVTNTLGAPITVGVNPVAVAITPDAATAFVTNMGDGTVSVIDTSTNRVTATVTVGTTPVAVAITPDGGRALVVNSGSNTVTPITVSGNLPGTPIGVGTAPDGIAITPDGATAYVSNSGDNTVTPVTIASGTAGTPIAVGTHPEGIAITPDGSTAYVAAGGDGTVTPITVASNTAGTAISVGSNAYAIAITPDGTKAFVTVFVWGLKTITLATNTVSNVSGLYNVDPRGITVAPNGTTAYYINHDDAYNRYVLWPINIAGNTAGTQIILGAAASQAVTVTPDQAPAAVLSVTAKPVGMASSFDASLSAVKYGSITSYTWSFGDGTAPVTTATPTTTHTYTSTGTYTATVTEKSSAGTSTTQVFTGQTMSRNGGLQAQASSTFTVGTVPVPTVTGLSPSSGPWTGATAVTVTGSGFTYASAVHFGLAAASSFTITNDGEISAVSPPGTDTVDVTVTTSAGTSATGPADQFTYIPPPSPTVSGVSPSSGPAVGGTAVTITGTGFVAVSGVSFGGTPAAGYTVTDATHIAAVSPARSGTVDVTVTNLGGASATSAADQFTYGPPVHVAYVGNALGGTVSSIDTVTKAVGAAMPVSASGLAITPDGRTLYATFGGWPGWVRAIDTATGQVVATISDITGAGPIAIAPDGQTAYVIGLSTVTPIDVATNQPETAMIVNSAGKMAITPDGSTALVTGYWGTVTWVDLDTRTVGTSINIGGNPDAVAITPDGLTALVTDNNGNWVTPISVQGKTAGTRITVGWGGMAIAITPDGETAFVTAYYDDTVTPIDISTRVSGTAIAVGAYPSAIAATPDGKTLYVVNSEGNNVTPVDVASGTAGAALPVGSWPNLVAITPDQAPIAHLSVTAAPPGNATSFDASASTVAIGSIASYRWSFGDGSPVETTTSPTTTHVYADSGDYTASVTETSSAGTSTVQVFTGQTMSRNGGPQAEAQASVTIGKAGTTTSVTPASPTTVYGQAQVFTATVSASPPASGTPTGTVQFTVDGSNHGSAQTLDSGGVATLAINNYPPGGHIVAAAYSGDGTYTASSAGGRVWQVNKASTAVAVSSDTNPADSGTTVTFSATVTPVAPGAGQPTGTVIFWYDGTMHMASLQPGGTATYATSTLTPGTHAVIADYRGNDNFYGEYSSTLSQVITGTATTTVVTTSDATAVTGQPLTFTATVTPGSGSGTPSGTVQFSVDGTAVGGSQTMSGGQASISDVMLTHAGSPHSVSAVYSGDSTFGGSTGSYAQTVAAADTTTTVVSATNPSVYGQGVTFTATVGAATPGTGTPSGTVTFKDGTTTLGTCSLTTGSCTSSSSSLAVSPHSITAVYAGDTNFTTSTSDVLTQTVGKAGTATTVASDANPSVVGQSVTFTATVGAAAPGAGAATGTVTFKAGTTTLGTCDLSTVPCAYSTTSLALGSHSITAEYGGDVSFSTSTSTVLTQTVGQATTSTSLASSLNPSVFGRSVTFTATVGPVAPATVTPTGTVTFKDGTGTLGTCSLAGGACTYSTSALSVGSHSITAVFDGSASWATSTSTAVSQAVGKASTTTTLISSVNPSVSGQGVTFTATVSVAAPPPAGLMAPVPVGTPTGTVQFAINGLDVGSPVTVDANRQAVSASITDLAVGGHSVTATYSGDGSFHGSSNSPAHTHTVNKASTATSLASSLNPSEVGQGVMFTATVSAVAPGAGTPTGTVQFVVNGADVGSPVALSDGAATSAVVTDLIIGSHHVTARYAGDGSFTGSSTGSALTQTVGNASSATGLTSSVNPSVFGQSVTFTATVSAVTNGAGTPTGTVTFKSGADVLGPCTLAAGSCTYSTIGLGVASHHITAVYGGDTTFSGSTSPAVTQTVNKASSTTDLTSSLNPSVFGQSVTFTATVAPVAPSTVTPTGTVTFKDGTLTLGTCSLSSGTCTYSTSTLAVRSHSITAVYAGSDSSTTSTSAAVSQIVNKASTSTALTSSMNPSVFGQGVTFTATVGVVAPGVAGLLVAVPVGTPTGTVQFVIDGTDVGSPVALDANQQATSPSIGNLAVGSHSVTAHYGGDGSFDGSTSTGQSQTVGKASSATTLTSSTNPSVLGQQVTLTATVAAVAPGAGTPTGTVTFKDGTTTLGSCALSAGSCTYSTASLAVGSHSITVESPGDTNFEAGTSAAVVQQVAYQIKSTPPKLTTKLGSTLVFKLQLTNSGGTNISSPSLTLTVTGSTVGTVTGSFVYVPGRTASASYYQFSLKTTGLKAGSYVLYVSVSGDPAAYSVPFTITSSKR